MEIMTCQNHQNLSSKDIAKWLIILKSKWHLECEGSGILKKNVLVGFIRIAK